MNFQILVLRIGLGPGVLRLNWLINCTMMNPKTPLRAWCLCPDLNLFTITMLIPVITQKKKKRSSICEGVCIYNVPSSILVTNRNWVKSSVNHNNFCVIYSLAGFTVLNTLVDHQPYSPNKTLMLSFLVSCPILNVIRGYEESDQYIHTSRVA